MMTRRRTVMRMWSDRTGLYRSLQLLGVML